MKKLLKLILIVVCSYPLQISALCIGSCTPNYSPMPVINNISNDIAPPVKSSKSTLQNKKTTHQKSQKTKINTMVNETNVPVKDYTSSNIIAVNPSVPLTKYFNSDDPNKYDSSNHLSNPFNFSLYKPTYIMPLFNNFERPNSAVAGEALNSSEFSVANPEFDFQISFKVPLWQNIFVWPDTLYAAYTQDSYWQLYTDDPYFRETDYEPEIFLDNEINKPLGGGWYFSDLALGAMHQSNGRGGATERSWNRAYFNTVFNNGNLMVSIEPWTPIFAKESSDIHNPDITHYLGYGQEMLAYDYDNNTFSLTTRNVLESGFGRGAEWLTWSFPLIHRNIKGYLYLFTGYGYDLIDYNHYTNGVGIGITLNDWL